MLFAYHQTLVYKINTLVKSQLMGDNHWLQVHCEAPQVIHKVSF